MRTFIRSPLTWLVIAEMVVVGALLVLAWNLVGSSLRPVASAPAQAEQPVASADDSSPLPDFPGLTGAGSRGPLPGLNLDSAFWRDRLVALNRDQVLMAQLEWRLVHAAMSAAESYVKDVVLPAIVRAERTVSG
jgi:hypothetical protein